MSRKQNFLLAGIALAGVLALGLPSTPSVAATSIGTTFQVTATIAASCTVSATDLSFGSYDKTQNLAQSAITVTCPNNTPYMIGLSEGGGTGATTSNRSMVGTGSAAGDNLPYRLFSDSSRTVNWGNNTAVDTYSGVASGAPDAIPVFGQIDANLTHAVGSYADTIVVTVTY